MSQDEEVNVFQKPEAVFQYKSEKQNKQYQISLMSNLSKLKETLNIRSGTACQEAYNAKIEKEHLGQSWQYRGT